MHAVAFAVPPSGVLPVPVQEKLPQLSGGTWVGCWVGDPEGGAVVRAGGVLTVLKMDQSKSYTGVLSGGVWKKGAYSTG